MVTAGLYLSFLFYWSRREKTPAGSDLIAPHWRRTTLSQCCKSTITPRGLRPIILGRSKKILLLVTSFILFIFLVDIWEKVLNFVVSFARGLDMISLRRCVNCQSTETHLHKCCDPEFSIDRKCLAMPDVTLDLDDGISCLWFHSISKLIFKSEKKSKFASSADDERVSGVANKRNDGFSLGPIGRVG